MRQFLAVVYMNIYVQHWRLETEEDLQPLSQIRPTYWAAMSTHNDLVGMSVKV